VPKWPADPTGTRRSGSSSVDAAGEVFNPAAFLTAAPNWRSGESFLLADGRRLRILEVRAELAEEMVDVGFNGIFVVEPFGE
jgi:hypothetical protein